MFSDYKAVILVICILKGNRKGEGSTRMQVTIFICMIFVISNSELPLLLSVYANLNLKNPEWSAIDFLDIVMHIASVRL